MDLLLLIALPFALAISFLSAGMEAGIFVLSRWRIGQQAREGNVRAQLLHRFLQNPENFLWTILAGNTLAAFAAVCITAVFLFRGFGQKPVWFALSFLVSVFLFYGFCDLLPKMLFRMFPNRLCSRMATPFRLLHITLSPLVQFIEGFSNILLHFTGGKIYTGHVFGSRDEFRSIALASGSGLTKEETSMINRVLELQNISARALAIPFSRFPNFSVETKLAEVIEHFKSNDQNVLPVWDSKGSAKRVAGFINLKEILYESDLQTPAPLSEYLSPALFVEETLRLDETLRRMQRAGRRMAVIIARDRRELGVITLEAILNVIFGEVNL